MRIYFVITGLGMGGAENQVASLAAEMSREHDVTIISLKQRPTSVNIASSVKVIHFEGGNLLSYIFIFYKLIRILNKNKPDVIHSHMIHANLISRFVYLFVKKSKLINTAHSTNEGGKVGAFLYRVTNFLCDVFTNVTENATKEFVRKKAAKENQIRCVYNGIDTTKFKFDLNARIDIRTELNITANDVVFLSVGRLNEAKDYPNLLNGFALLNIPNKKLFIVGDGPLRSEIESLIISLGLTNHVTLLGIRTDVPEIMSAADFFILSSAWEGFGLVIAEAMLCELPVIATDCGGVKEVIGGYGFLAKPQDFESLAEKIKMCTSLKNKDLKILKCNAKKHIIENYSLKKIVRQWLTIYLEGRDGH